MSKMDALRAMREAKYEAAQKTAQKTSQKTSQKAGAKAPQARTRPPVAPPTTTPAAKAKPEALCGHRNMSGRTCTREHGHAAKSHRYSS